MFPPNVPYITSYGPLDPNLAIKVNPTVIEGSKAEQVTVNGDLLTRFTDNYSLIAVTFHWDGSKDPSDSPNVSRTGLFDIHKGLIHMAIPWNEHFEAEVIQNPFAPTNYALLLVPKDFGEKSFGTIRQAVSQGAREIDHRGKGHPTPVEIK